MGAAMDLAGSPYDGGQIDLALGAARSGNVHQPWLSLRRMKRCVLLIAQAAGNDYPLERRRTGGWAI